jgi:hypothetical protein
VLATTTIFTHIYFVSSKNDNYVNRERGVVENSSLAMQCYWL